MNIKFTLCIILFVVLNARAQVDSIKYHDGQMETQWGSSTANDEFGCFVRFTPASYPAQLVGVKGYFRNAGANSTFRWKVYSDPNGTTSGGTTAIYQSPFTWMNPAAGGIVDQQYELFTDLTSDSIIVTAGDLYVGAVQSNYYFGMGLDNAPDDSVAVDRQWQWMTVFGQNYWNTMTSQASGGQFGITAYFNALSTNVKQQKDFVQKIFFRNDNLVIERSLNTMSDLEILSIDGKLLFRKTINLLIENIPVNLKDGIYLIHITNSEETITLKIIKS